MRFLIEGEQSWKTRGSRPLTLTVKFYGIQTTSPTAYKNIKFLKSNRAACTQVVRRPTAVMGGVINVGSELAGLFRYDSTNFIK